MATVRKTSLAFANIQRLSIATGRWVLDPEHLETNPHLHRINVPSCPWLEDANKSSDLPFYLWDIEGHRTIQTSDLSCDFEYTCISHTWGRWRGETTVRLANVPWEVPQVSRYTVEDLPEHFSQQKWPTKYLWFDLFCIPQDGSLRANLEIAKQASIFRKAAQCIIWMNDVEMWSGTQVGLAYFALLHLRNGESELEADECWAKANELLADESSPYYTRDQADHSQYSEPGWLSSLWTLQEGLLCPHALLADRHWRVLTYKSGIVATLENVVYCIRTSLQTYTKHRDASELPPHAISVFKAFNVSELAVPSRMSPFVAGSFRECTSHRAEAIMSVIGVTDWYLPYIQAHHGNLSRTDNLVMGRYPIEFVRETAQQLGAAFYFFWYAYRTINSSENREVILPGPQFMLPLVAEKTFPGEDSITAENIGDDAISHPSIFSWLINIDGKVNMKRVAVICSNEFKAIRDGEVFMNRGGGWERQPSLQEYVDKSAQDCLRVFISICACQGSNMGLVLESSSDSQMTPVLMNKTAICFTAGSWCVPETAVERLVDWLVA